TDGVQKLLVEWDDASHPASPTLNPHSDPTAQHRAPSTQHSGPSTQNLPPRDHPTGLASRLRILGQPVLGVVERPGGDTARQTECVMIPSDPGPDSASTTPRRTACISSQVGCPVGCAFCASS